MEANNAKKTREALLQIQGIICSIEHDNPLEVIYKVCEAALAAPPRNCDRFDDDDDAFAAWHDSLVDGDVVCVRNGFRWLFATASQEGDGHAEN